MARLTRFLHLEKRRSAQPEPPRGLVQTQRFGGGPSVDPREAPSARSGAETRRFEAPAPGPAGPPAEPPLRLRDDDGGLPFIRCASCRMDHPVGAVRCELCEADLTTARQRSDNLALRERWLSEREEERRQIEVMALARRQAEQEVREAEQLFWSAH